MNVVYMLSDASVWSQLLSSGFCQDLQMEWCQFLVNQTVCGEGPSVRSLLCAFMSCDLGTRLLSCCQHNYVSIFICFNLRTLFKFLKMFEGTLTGPCLPALVESKSHSSNFDLDSLDPNFAEVPIQLFLSTLKSSLPGQGRDLEVVNFSLLAPFYSWVIFNSM